MCLVVRKEMANLIRENTKLNMLLNEERERRVELEDAVIELAELYSEQDDAIVELAEIIEEGM